MTLLLLAEGGHSPEPERHDEEVTDAAQKAHIFSCYSIVIALNVFATDLQDAVKHGNPSHAAIREVLVAFIVERLGHALQAPVLATLRLDPVTLAERIIFHIWPQNLTDTEWTTHPLGPFLDHLAGCGPIQPARYGHKAVARCLRLAHRFVETNGALTISKMARTLRSVFPGVTWLSPRRIGRGRVAFYIGSGHETSRTAAAFIRLLLSETTNALQTALADAWVMVDQQRVIDVDLDDDTVLIRLSE